MAARLDIALQRNEDWPRRLTFIGDDGLPLDLTDMTVAMQVRDKLTQTLVTQAEVSIVDAQNGIAEVLLHCASGPLGQYGNPIQIAYLPYDVRLTDADNVSVIAFSGLVTLSRGETQ